MTRRRRGQPGCLDFEFLRNRERSGLGHRQSACRPKYAWPCQDHVMRQWPAVPMCEAYCLTSDDSPETCKRAGTRSHVEGDRSMVWANYIRFRNGAPMREIVCLSVFNRHNQNKKAFRSHLLRKAFIRSENGIRTGGFLLGKQSRPNTAQARSHRGIPSLLSLLLAS